MQKHKFIYLIVIIITSIILAESSNIFGTELEPQRISNILSATITVKKPYSPPPGNGGGYIPAPPEEEKEEPEEPEKEKPEPEEEYIPPTFTDTSGHWASTDIARAAQLQIIFGYPDGTFRPNAETTRAEFIAMLVRALGLEADSAVTFTDEIPGWALPFISAAVKAGLISGYNDGTFRPNQMITRAEMAVILARVLGTLPGGEHTFTDEIPEWALNSIITVQVYRLFQGFPDGTFRPYDSATRAQACTVIMRLLDLE